MGEFLDSTRGLLTLLVILIGLAGVGMAFKFVDPFFFIAALVGGLIGTALLRVR